MKNNEKFNRIRPLKIWEILQRETDEDHPMGTEELRAKLMECGIEAHRTTIYEDIKLLEDVKKEDIEKYLILHNPEVIKYMNQKGEVVNIYHNEK